MLNSELLAAAPKQAESSPEVLKVLVAANLRDRPFINGRFVEPHGGDIRPNECPATGMILNEVAECDAIDVDRAVRSAAAAAEAWADIAPFDRKKILLAFAQKIEAHADELAALDALDVGKPFGVTRAVDLGSTIKTTNWYAELVDKVYGELAPTGKLDAILREPLGVVAAITPWNYPLMIAAWKFAPILAAGNSLVLKPAEQSPLSALRVAELASEAGIPDGVFNVVIGSGEVVGAALGRHDGVRGIAFTGSTATGKRFYEYASTSSMRSISLECGGKSALIVHADADVSDVAAKLAAGLFYNAGQSCNAPTRLIVHETLANEMVSRLKEVAREYYPNNPFASGTKVGAIVSDEQLQRIEGFVRRAEAEGATVEIGGKACYSHGYYYEPTILTNVKRESEIATEEVFGPVLPVELYSTIDEALTLANSTSYGLWANVFTNQMDVATLLGRRLKAGTVGFNMTFGGDITTPLGGYKESGVGRDRSVMAFEKYTQVKHLSFPAA